MSKRTVVVTGASSGIGHACAIEFANRGYSVIAGARRLESMENLKKIGVRTIKLDVTSDKDVDNLKQLIEDEYDGELLYLHNNAGQTLLSAATEIDIEKSKKIYDVNYFGAIRVTKALTPFLIKTKGTIGFTGSVGALLSIPFLSTYASSKAALHSYAKILSVELQPFGVKVIDIITGTVSSGMEPVDELPLDSKYRVKGFKAYEKKFREAMTQTPITPEIYAKRVISDFEKSKIGRVEYFRGKGASLIKFISGWVPFFLQVRLVKAIFGLGEIFSTIKATHGDKKLA